MTTSVLAAGLAFVSGTGGARADTRTSCVFDPGAGTLTIVMNGDQPATTPATELTITREPNSADKPGAFRIRGTGLNDSSCETKVDDNVTVTPTVNNVNTVLVRLEGLHEPSLTIDTRNGPFSPGKVPALDPFGVPSLGGGTPPSASLGEDAISEIEFDVRYNLLRSSEDFLGATFEVPSLTIQGSEGADHVTLGMSDCLNEPSPHCRDLAVNLNDDGDADVRVSIVEGGATARSNFGVVTVWGSGGDDVIDARGGRGTGGPVRSPFADWTQMNPPGVTDLVLNGESGDDTLFGGDGGDTLIGGAGDDLLVDGPGNDKMHGDCPSPDDAAPTCTGDDVLDMGEKPNGDDNPLSGGPGHDVVDYSRRTAFVSVTAGKGADDGEQGEGDNVLGDVEEARLPGAAPPTPVPGLNVVTEMEAVARCRPPGSITSAPRGPCPIAVDPVHNIGVSMENRGAGLDPRWVIYDLERLAPVAQGTCGGECPDIDQFVIDPQRQRMYGPGPLPLWTDSDSGERLTEYDCTVDYLDYVGLTVTRGELPYEGCADGAATATPDALPELAVLDVSFDPSHDDLYLTGAPLTEHPRRANPLSTSSGNLADFAFGNLGGSLIVRKVHLLADRSKGTAEWDIDLRYAGCGRRVGVTNFDPQIRRFVARIGNDLLAYCFDPEPTYWGGSPAGQQGYLVRVPLAGGSPLPRGAQALQRDPGGAFVNYRSVRTPTLSGTPTVLLDPVTGTVVLVTDGKVNGNAAWVFNPGTDSFVGVAAGGVTDQPDGNTAVGLDPSRGRAYLLTKDGVVMFPLRSRPLPAGQRFPVAANNPIRPHTDWANFPSIYVAPGLHRLFVPVNLTKEGRPTARYVVVDDVIPEESTQVRDPDVNTTDVDEAEGLTEATARVQADATGAHVIAVGGVTRTVDAADPACFTSIPIFDTPPTRVTARLYGGEIEGTGTVEGLDARYPSVFGNGGCLAEQFVAPGQREFFLSATAAEAASRTSSVASAAGFSFSPEDVTTSDVEHGGACGAGFVNTLTRGEMSEEDQGRFADGCDDFWDGATARETQRDEFGEPTGSREDAPAHPMDPRQEVPDPREGTRGRDGTGFPIPEAACSDFAGVPDSDASDQQPLAASTAYCNVAGTEARTSSEAPGFVLAAEGQPVLSVARTASSIISVRGDDGQVTVATALAEGVHVGPLSIREVRSVAVTRARGRPGTAEATLKRLWCGVTLNGEDPLASGNAVGEEDPVDGLRCIDPASPDNAQFLEDLNFALAGKVRITVTRANEETEADGATEAGEDSPGGYEAVVIKHPDARGGDQAVNDDDSHTVAGLQAVVYNDGPNGRNRYVVQLAGVHAESRYGITVLPQFEGFEPSEFSSNPGQPGTRRVIPGTRRLPTADTLIAGVEFDALLTAAELPALVAGDSDERNFFQWLGEALKDLLRLLIQHPLEFLLLFLVFSWLATPPYLAYRRRTFAGMVT